VILFVFCWKESKFFLYDFVPVDSNSSRWHLLLFVFLLDVIFSKMKFLTCFSQNLKGQRTTKHTSMSGNRFWRIVNLVASWKELLPKAIGLTFAQSSVPL
jgi:hypothetical protein